MIRNNKLVKRTYCVFDYFLDVSHKQFNRRLNRALHEQSTQGRIKLYFQSETEYTL